MPCGLKPEGPEIAMHEQTEKSYRTLLVQVPPAMKAAIRDLLVSRDSEITGAAT
jgi:hypothetical protein